MIDRKNISFYLLIIYLVCDICSLIIKMFFFTVIIFCLLTCECMAEDMYKVYASNELWFDIKYAAL